MLFGLMAVPTADLLELTDAQITGYEWSLGDRNVINVVQFNYDFDTAGSVAQFGTRETFEQSASINKYGRRPALLIDSRGIKTANGGAAIALNRARGVIDRFAEPPLILRLECFYQKHLLEAGDQIRVTHPNCPNPLTGTPGLVRDLFEVMDVTPDFARGRVRLTCVFLSAIPPQPAPVSTEAISTPGVRVDTTPPAVPTGLAVTTTSELLADGTFIGIADVTWTANTEADLSHYRLRWRKQGAAAFQELTISAAASPRSILRELSPNTIYEVQVAAVDFFLNASAFTASVTGTTPADPGIPAVPSGLTLTAFPLAVALTWNKNAESDIAAYDLQRADDAAFTVNVSVRSVDVTAFVDKVGDTVTRFYQVRAVRRTGAFSAYSAAVSGAGTQVGTNNLVDLAVTTAKIADLNVTNAKIAALAVDAAKIANATITTAKIADAAITTGKIDNAQITIAKIANLAVDTARIVDLTVTTLKIAGAAVNAMGQSQTAGTLSVSVQTEQTVESVVFTPNNTSSEIEVYAKFQHEQDDVSSGNTVTIRVKRDSVVLDTTVLDLDQTKRVFMATVKEVSPGTSAVTYAVTVQQTGGSVIYSNRLLRVAESKK